jgi:hypothetical protein
MANNHTQAITLLFGAYGQGADKQRIAIYCKVLQDIPQELLLSVVQKTMLENKFLPSIAELAEACKSITSTVTGNKLVPDWGEAWHEIERAMQSTPWGKKPEFSHPAIADAVNQYGWNDLQTCLASEFSTVRAQIRRMYDEAAKRYVERKTNEVIISKNPALQQAEIYQRLGGGVNA